MKTIAKSNLWALGLLLYSSLSFAQSSVVIDVTLNPMGNFSAKSQTIQGKALLKNGVVTAEKVVLPAKSLKTGIEMRDKHLLKYLEAEKYPEIVLIKGEGKDGKGKGHFKIKGITKEVPASYKVQDKLVEAELILKLSDFDIKDIQYMGVGVEDEVKVHVKLPLEKAP